jgi:hypothetical protein
MEEQDRTLDTISGTLNTLHQQAGLMGQELTEHNEYVCLLWADTCTEMGIGCWSIWRAKPIEHRADWTELRREWTTSYGKPKVSLNG